MHGFFHMTPSKFRKNGFMYLEVVFAVVLLGVFGSTLFMSQSYVVRRIARSHVSMKAYSEMDSLILEYKMKMKQAELGEQSILIPTITRSLQNPEMDLSVSGKYIELSDGSKKGKSDSDEKPSIFQIQAEADHEFGKDTATLLLYKPQP